jgi:oxygen-independent coproporphyrinogen-3 oxidase
MPESGEVSLYVHIPFCTRKCPYCHFYVLPDREALKEQLLDGLQREWQRLAPRIQGKKIASIYFGGGTPFLFGPERIRAVLSWFPWVSPCEITLEANPEHVTPQQMAAYADAGVTRVSLGVQSFDPSSLVMLGRSHDASQVHRALDAILRSGIRNTTIDLMYDVPGQTLASWQETVRQAVRLPVTHLSLYNLTIEPHTSYAKRQKSLAPLLPSPEESVELLRCAVETFEAHGFKRYEISAFARPGFASVHNMGYWTYRPFFGLGPSAYSFWEGKRFRNSANLSRYRRALVSGNSPVDFEEELPFPDNLHEQLAVRLRLLSGVDLATLPPLPAATQSRLDTLLLRGWIVQEGSRIRLTDAGLLFYDSVAVELV